MALFLIGQIMIWFQTNAQFISPWAKKNPWLLSIVGGSIISYMFIKATAFVANYYDGALWPGRFIGFSLGICSFTFLTWYFMNEGINGKIMISLVLSFILICVQLLWK